MLCNFILIIVWDTLVEYCHRKLYTTLYIFNVGYILNYFIYVLLSFSYTSK